MQSIGMFLFAVRIRTSLFMKGTKNGGPRAVILAFALAFYLALGSSATNSVMPSFAQGPALEISSTIPIPPEISSSVVDTLRKRPTHILPGNKLIITSLDQNAGAALLTVAVRPENQSRGESILANSAIVIARSSPSGWTGAIMGTDTYEALLAEAPAALVPAGSKSFLSARGSRSPLAPQSISTNLRWPWSSSATWEMSQGPHSWWGAGKGSDTSAIDFAPRGGDLSVRAAAAGTIIRRCDSTLTREIAIRHPTGTSNDNVTGYLHLDINGGALAVGTPVNAGDQIGTIYNGAPNDGCGYGNGAHLHFWIATIPTSVSSDHPSIYSFSLGNMYGQSLSGWQMQGDNCFHNGLQRPLCPGDPIPGDGSAPGPRPPSNLTATPVSSSQINLSWSGSPDSVDGYKIYSGSSVIDKVTNTSYSVSGLSACSTYSFFVTAYKGTLESGGTNAASAKTFGCSSGAPSAPSLNSPYDGQVFPRYGDIYLIWNSNGSYRYLVEFWGGPDGGKSNLPWQAGTSLYFGNGNWGGNYSWHVKSQNSVGQVSDWSETRSFFKKYGTPNNVQVSPLSSSQTRLTWDPSADAPGNIEGYKIYRDGQLRYVAGSGATLFDDNDLVCNTSHSYYLKAYKGSGESDPSNTVSATTSSCPPPRPSANFDAWPQSGTAPLVVAMHIVDTSNITSCSWDYGDGQMGTSCASLHNHTYNNAGSYTVRLTVSGPGGSDTLTRSGYINVSNGSTNSKIFLPAIARALSSSGWSTILSENFESGFPGVWAVSDNGAVTGQYYWGKRSCRAYAGSYSGWAVGGGTSGSALGCNANYPDYAQAWMVYGPFSLSGATAGELNARIWTHTEWDPASNTGYDKLCMMASTNGINFWGTCYFGDFNWAAKTLDLTNVYTLGNLMGQSNVWIAFIFSSDYSVNYAEGAYVDDIVLRKCPSGATCPAAASPMITGGARGKSFNTTLKRVK